MKTTSRPERPRTSLKLPAVANSSMRSTLIGQVAKNMMKMTREILETAFDAVARKAASEGLMLEIMVYGGACLILASNMREASSDVDAVYLNQDRETRSRTQQIADEVAMELGLPDAWLNQAVKQMLNPAKGVREAAKNLFREYPRDPATAPGLRVMVPHPSYMLAMKIMAQRDDTLDDGKIETDRTDAIALMRVTGLTDKDAIIKLMREVYPQVPGMGEGPMNDRILKKIDSLIREYGKTPDAPTPSWNIARGRGERDGR